MMEELLFSTVIGIDKCLLAIFFGRYAIDAMQSACLKEAGANAVAELAQETTLIQLIFGGYLHSKVIFGK